MLDLPGHVIIHEPNKPIPRDTTVTGWRAFFRSKHIITFQIWRPVGDTTYKLVGHTKYTPTRVGVSEKHLSAGQEFRVNAGDVLGHFLHNRSSIPYTDITTMGCDAPSGVRYRDLPEFNGVPGSILDFDAAESDDCREYSFQVALKGIYI